MANCPFCEKVYVSWTNCLRHCQLKHDEVPTNVQEKATAEREFRMDRSPQLGSRGGGGRRVSQRELDYLLMRSDEYLTPGGYIKGRKLMGVVEAGLASGDLEHFGALPIKKRYEQFRHAIRYALAVGDRMARKAEAAMARPKAAAQATAKVKAKAKAKSKAKAMTKAQAKAKAKTKADTTAMVFRTPMKAKAEPRTPSRSPTQSALPSPFIKKCKGRNPTICVHGSPKAKIQQKLRQTTLDKSWTTGAALCVAFPWSRLLVMGLKAYEVRAHPISSPRVNFEENQTVFIIECQPGHGDPFEHVELPGVINPQALRRHRVQHIVGKIIFEGVEEIKDTEALHERICDHLIKPSSPHYPKVFPTFMWKVKEAYEMTPVVFEPNNAQGSRKSIVVPEHDVVRRR